MKGGTRIEYTFAAGKTVPGRIVRQHKNDMADWFVCKLTDEAGDFTVSCHMDQIRVIDNHQKG